MCIGTIGNPKAGGPSQASPERVALRRPTLTDAQSLFYNARYEEAAGLALALRVSDTEDLARVELRSSALLFQLKALLQRRPDKEDALGWLNLYVGYITQVGQKNKKDAQPYLYKATQIVSAASKSQASKQPIPYEMIGNYYFDELNKLTKEVTAMIADQKETDPPEVAKQKVEDIKAKVALANGTAERAMDAFARAYNLGVAKAYKDLMYKNLQDAFKVLWE